MTIELDCRLVFYKQLCLIRGDIYLIHRRIFLVSIEDNALVARIQK